jgi:hypothetical protein
MGVSAVSVYNKLQGIETGISHALVRDGDASIAVLTNLPESSPGAVPDTQVARQARFLQPLSRPSLPSRRTSPPNFPRPSFRRKTSFSISAANPAGTGGAV